MLKQGWGHRLRHILHMTGLDEHRCAACLSPFSSHVPMPASRAEEDPLRASRLAAALLCPECLASMPRRLGGYCPLCGEMTAQVQPGGAQANCANLPIVPCGECLQKAPLWRNFRFYGVFEGTLRDLLIRGKYRSDVAALDALACLLVELCADLPVPDAIVPMPLHAKRLRGRGYNQSRELALRLARHWRVPLQDGWLKRVRHTLPQTGLSRAARLRNLDGIFEASEAVRGKNIVVVDDTATTGTSLQRCTESLLAAGAAHIDVAVLARADRHAAVS